MEENTLESIVLDNGIEYLIYETEIIDNIEYTLFVNINNEDDICFRKTITENNQRYFVGLDDDKEFEKVLLRFTKKDLNN